MGIPENEDRREREREIDCGEERLPRGLVLRSRERSRIEVILEVGVGFWHLYPRPFLWRIYLSDGRGSDPKITCIGDLRRKKSGMICCSQTWI